LLAPLLAAGPQGARAETLPVGIPPSRRIAFEVLRNGGPIGTHILTFKPTDNRLTVAIDIHIAAGIGPVTLYRYDMQGTEVWENGQFSALDTTTNDDGTRHVVAMRRAEAGIRVQSTGFPDLTIPTDTLPLTHWYEPALGGPLVSPQDGQPMKATISSAGSRAIILPNGRTVSARGYHIASKTPVQDWFDSEKIWVGLHADAKDGSSIDYKLT
jgi:hypothetical protein